MSNKKVIKFAIQAKSSAASQKVYFIYFYLYFLLLKYQ